MAPKHVHFWLAVLLLQCFRLSFGISHWVVTKEGRIEAQMNSVFNMKRPYDLVAFLEQEKRFQEVEVLRVELLNHKLSSDGEAEGRSESVQSTLYRTDPDCLASEKRLLEFDFYLGTVLPWEHKGVVSSQFLSTNIETLKPHSEPDCSQVQPLEFSPHAFEHLKAMQIRHNLTVGAEPALRSAVTDLATIEEYGNRVGLALAKNKTSWVLYNMAAYYWRMKGNAPQSVECLRRALNFSPRRFKDVSLISLGNVLHRAHQPEDAIIVVYAALDIDDRLSLAYFTLANIYAVMLDFESAVAYLEKTMTLQPDFREALVRRHALLCHAKVQTNLEQQHNHLEETLRELNAFQEQHKKWDHLQIKLLNEQATDETKQAQQRAYEHWKAMHESIDSQNGYCRVGVDGIHCDQPGMDQGLKPAGSSEEALAKKADSDNAEQPPPAKTRDDSRPGSKMYDEPVSDPLFPKNKKAEKPEKTPTFRKKGWPTKEECDNHVKKLPAWNEYPTNWLPAENKGLDVKPLLNEAQGLKQYEEHPLPWYPPMCNNLEPRIPESEAVFSHLDSVRRRHEGPIKVPDFRMKKILMQYVDGDMTEEELGQRILSAMQKDIGPKWIILNLAVLYWRVLGHIPNAIECARRSIFLAPPQYADVPMLNLANVLYVWGKVNDAELVGKAAYQVNSVEPNTNFFLGSMLASRGNLSRAQYHYDRALKFQPDHLHSMRYLRLAKCYIKYYKRDPAELTSVQCEVNPSKTMSTCIKRGTPLNNPSPVIIVNDNEPIPSDIAKLLEQIKDTYRQRGICAGEECEHMVLKMANHELAHIRLDLIDGVFYPKFILTSRVEEVIAKPNECVIYSNGRKSPGCKGKQIKGYAKSDYLSHWWRDQTVLEQQLLEFVEVLEQQFDPADESKHDLKFDATSGLHQASKTSFSILASLKDPKRHITKRHKIKEPTLAECQSIASIDFAAYLTSWLSPQTKGINLRRLFTFEHDVSQKLEPICDDKSVPKLKGIDELIEVDAKQDNFFAEQQLRQVLLNLTCDCDSTQESGTRIALGMRKNQTSWVHPHMAALFWRAKGNGQQALRCLRAAYHRSPAEVKDIALAGLGSIMWQTLKLDEALALFIKALDIAPETILLHFTLGNLYAARNDIENAIAFFESTLAMQPEFAPGLERLRFVLCRSLAEQ